jgi:Zn-dependent peptidase ImmA (M78 family)/DNA-binding XRE family transcriptional regulator
MSNLIQFPDRGAAFIPQRLVEARMVLQISRAELARALNLTGQAIGYYETGERRPDMSILSRIAEELQQPVSFFLRSGQQLEGNLGTRFFRSIGTRSNKINNALDVKAKWLRELLCTISKEIRFPNPNLPSIPPSRGASYSFDEIENIATSLRRHWGLGDGPILNIIALFETYGITITRFELGSDVIDAFSCWIGRRPYVFLGSDKRSCCRSRFDAAHELGHLLMHGDIAQEDIEDKKTRDRIEREANLFAGAFLIPRNSLLREFYSTRVPHIKGLKERWKVSMQALAHRAKEIGIIDELQYISFRKQISFHNWTKGEPLDDQIPLEQPQLLLRSWIAFAEKRGI